MDVKKIIEKAIEGRTHTYSPYSNFGVGAAILLKNGEYILGCNVENISYGLTICAERNALFQLVIKGYTKDDVLGMCVVGDTINPISPCGACRQVMAELLDENTPIILSNLKYEYKETTVKELIPYCFEELK